jgi:hypothetical protein
MEWLNVTPGIRPYWSQPKVLERTFELREGDHLLGTLHFAKSWGSLATASLAAGEWTFKRTGYFRPRVTVRRRGQEADLAVYQPKVWGSEGELQFAGGRSSGWRSANFWATQYAFLDSVGRALVTFKPGAEDKKWSDVFKFQALVEIDPSAHGLEELPLLLALGWYLMILHHGDVVSGGAVAGAAG